MSQVFVNTPPSLQNAVPLEPKQGPSCFHVLTNTLEMANDLASQVMCLTERLLGPVGPVPAGGTPPATEKPAGLFGAIDENSRETSRRMAAALDALNSINRVLP